MRLSLQVLFVLFFYFVMAYKTIARIGGKASLDLIPFRLFLVQVPNMILVLVDVVVLVLYNRKEIIIVQEYINSKRQIGSKLRDERL